VNGLGPPGLGVRYAIGRSAPDRGMEGVAITVSQRAWRLDCRLGPRHPCRRRHEITGSSSSRSVACKSVEPEKRRLPV